VCHAAVAETGSSMPRRVAALWGILVVGLLVLVVFGPGGLVSVVGGWGWGWEWEWGVWWWW
jgi:hypothetical protein